MSIFFYFQLPLTVHIIRCLTNLPPISSPIVNYSKEFYSLSSLRYIFRMHSYGITYRLTGSILGPTTGFLLDVSYDVSDSKSSCNSIPGCIMINHQYIWLSADMVHILLS